MKRERDSGMETLRLLAMVLVILVHTFSYGGFFDAACDVGGRVRALAIFVKLATRAAVPLFVLISGFFMSGAAFDLKKQFRRAGSIYLTILFYSVALSAVFLCLGKDYLYYGDSVMPTAKVVLRALFPISAQQWYFLTDYLLLCLVAPFANLAVQQLTKKQHTVLIAVLFWVFSVWLTLSFTEPFRTWFVRYGYEDIVGGKNLPFFLFLYLLGGYIARHAKKRERPHFGFLALAFGALLTNYLLFTRLPKEYGWRETGTKYSNVLVLLFAAALLLFFKDLHFHCRPLNLLAGTTLGVYAVHEFCFVRNQLWSWIDFSAADCSSVWKNAALLALAAGGILLACGGIDLLRQALFRFFGASGKKIGASLAKKSN